MKTSTSLLSALVLAGLPGMAAAQEFSGAITLGYGMTDLSDVSEDITTTTLDGRFGMDLGNGFRFGADLSVGRGKIDGVPESLTASMIGVYGAYSFDGGFSLGAYVEDAELDIEGAPTDLSATSYGLMAGYDMGQARFGGFLGRTTTDPDLPAGIDVRDFGLTLRYAAAPEFTLGASFVRTEVSDGVTDVDLDFLGVAGAYTIDPTWSLFGGISNASVDLIDADVTTFGLGVSYDLSSKLGAGSSLSLELARSNASVGGGGDGHLNTVRLGLSIPLGSQGFTVPMNSVADSIMNPRHSALSSTVLSVF